MAAPQLAGLPPGMLADLIMLTGRHDFLIAGNLQRFQFRPFAFAPVVFIVEQAEFALHALDNSRQHLARFLPVGLAEPDTFNRPICVRTRFALLTLDNDADESRAVR